MWLRVRRWYVIFRNFGGDGSQAAKDLVDAIVIRSTDNFKMKSRERKLLILV